MQLGKIILCMLFLSSPAFALAESSNHDKDCNEVTSQSQVNDEAQTRKPNSESDLLSIVQAGRPIFGHK